MLTETVYLAKDRTATKGRHFKILEEPVTFQQRIYLKLKAHFRKRGEDESEPGFSMADAGFYTMCAGAACSVEGWGGDAQLKDLDAKWQEIEAEGFDNYLKLTLLVERYLPPRELLIIQGEFDNRCHIDGVTEKKSEGPSDAAETSGTSPEN